MGELQWRGIALLAASLMLTAACGNDKAAAPDGGDAGAGADLPPETELPPPTLCDRVCAATHLLPCASNTVEECRVACPTDHQGRCGGEIEAMQACLIEATEGWSCQLDAVGVSRVSVNRAACPAEIAATEECLSSRPDSSVDVDVDGLTGADVETMDLPDAGAGDASDASDVGSGDSDDAGDGASSPADLGPPTGCAAYCAALLAVNCPRDTLTGCLKGCQLEESGPCASAASALHSCALQTAGAWECVQGMSAGLKDNVCANEAVGLLVCSLP